MSNTNLWVKFVNITITGCDDSISLDNVQNVIFSNMTVANIFYDIPITISSSKYISLYNFRTIGNNRGLRILNSSYVSIMNSVFQSRLTYPYSYFYIYISSSDEVSLQNNSLSSTNSVNGLSVYVLTSTNINITQNKFLTISGISFQGSSSINFNNNYIYSSEISIDNCTELKTENNIIIGQGFLFYSYDLTYPINEQLFHFVFLNNTVNGLQVLYLYSRSNYKVMNATFGNILLVGGNNVTLENCNFTSIDVIKSTNVLISHSTFFSGNLIESNGAVVQGNQIYNGIIFQSSNDLVISNNTFFYKKDLIGCINNYPLHTDTGPFGPTHFVLSNNTLIEYNTFYNGINLEFVQNLTIKGNIFNNSQNASIDTYNGIIIYYGNSFNIINNIFSKNLGNGIDLGYSSYATVSNNSIIDNLGTGVSLFYVNNSVIQNNVILKNSEGVYIGNAYNITMAHNDISMQTDRSFVVNGTTHYYVDPNSGTGIYITNGSFIQINNNAIRYNSGTGIHTDSSSNITMTNNTIEWNGDFVRLVTFVLGTLVIVLVGASLIIGYMYFNKKKKTEKKIF